MADYGFIANQPQTNPFQRMSEVVNFARGANALQRERETLESDIAQKKAESGRAVTEADVSRRTADPRVKAQEELAKQAEFKTNLDKFKLTGEYVQKSRDISQSLVSDPDVVNGNVEGIVPKIAQARQMMIDSGVPPHVAEAQSAMLMSQAVKDPKSVRQILLNSIQAGVGSAGQSANVQEGGIPVTNNNQTSVVATRPLAATPVGQPIPGTQQTMQVPVAQQQTVDYNPITQSPTVTTKNPQGQVTGVNPAPTGAGVPQLAPGQPQDIPILTQTRAATNTAASKAPESRFNNSQILKLIDETDTGRRAELVRTLKGPLAGLPWETQGATKFDQLGDFIALEAANNAAAMGAGTDAARSLAEQKTASTGWTPAAIKSAVKINDALATGVQNFNKGMEAAIQRAGGNVLAVRPFQNAWSQAFDPNVYRFANALETGDKAEINKILGPEGSPARKAKAAELAKKSATLHRLSTEGQEVADPVTAALMQEAGQTRRSGDARPAGFPVESPAENRGRMEGRAATLQAELANPELMGGESARGAVTNELADTQRRLGAAPAPAAAPQQPAANDPITAALLAESKGGEATDLSIPGNPIPGSRPEVKQPSRFEQAKTALSSGLAGPLEAGVSMATGAAGQVVGSVMGLIRGVTDGKYGTAEGAREAQARAAEVAHSLTLEPRTEAGKTILEGIGQFAEQSGATRLAGIGPAEGMMLAGASVVPRIAPKGAPAPAPAAKVPGQMGSVGAAGATPAQQAQALVAKASPALQKEVAKVGEKLTPEGLKTVERHVDADTLPVPIKLMPGQATQNVTLLSQEQNARGAKPQIAARVSEQNAQLGENLREIRDSTAPDVYSTSRPAMGETLIDSYKAKDAKLNADISAKYKALEDANGGNFPVDAAALVKAADANLHKELLFDHVPPAIRSTLDRLQKEGMTFENFESLRTRLAAIQRSQADGNVKSAAGVIRDIMEELPMAPGAENLKPLADAARAAARERFALIEGDPAYKAVVRGKASADRFLDKYVLNADTKHVEAMKKNLAHDDVAHQTMAAGALKRLEDRAGLIDYTGNFSPAGYNKALEGLGSKMDILFVPEQKSLVEQLGRVSRYVKGQPTGSFVNNSNTAVALLGGAAKLGAQTAANAALPGFGVGDKIRAASGFVKERMDLNQSMKQYGGLRLKDVK